MYSLTIGWDIDKVFCIAWVVGVGLKPAPTNADLPDIYTISPIMVSRFPVMISDYIRLLFSGYRQFVVYKFQMVFYPVSSFRRDLSRNPPEATPENLDSG